VLDLALWAGRKVPERTADRQHPIIKVSNLADNFALAWYAGGTKTPPDILDQVDELLAGLDDDTPMADQG